MRGNTEHTLRRREEHQSVSGTVTSGAGAPLLLAYATMPPSA